MLGPVWLHRADIHEASSKGTHSIIPAPHCMFFFPFNCQLFEKNISFPQRKHIVRQEMFTYSGLLAHHLPVPHFSQAAWKAAPGNPCPSNHHEQVSRQWRPEIFHILDSDYTICLLCHISNKTTIIPNCYKSHVVKRAKIPAGSRFSIPFQEQMN